MKLRKRLTSLLLSAALIAGLLPSVVPQARAEESAATRQGAQFGYSGMRDGDHVLFGYADEASTYPISWKILDNDADNRGKSGAMLLFSDEVLGSSSYAQNYFTWEWYDCAASEWCAAYAESSKHFDTKWMQGRIRVVTKTWESDSWSDDGTGWPGKSSNICSYNPNSNVWEDTPQYGKMFCLSLLEARKYLTAEDYATFRYDTKEESSWWLRNCISYYNNGGNPVCYGLQYDAGTKRTEAEWYSVKNGMRPAFNFELPGNYSVKDYQSYGGQILLTVAEETVKNPTGMHAVPEYAEGEDITWSMVVRDPNGHDNLQVTVHAPDGYKTPTAGTGVLTGQVNYPSHWWGSSDGIDSIENEYLTAVMVEKNTGKIAFMGTVGQMLSTTVGGFTIPIPTGAKGQYDVYIFNEHNDGTGGVRYASDVKRVATINVTADTTKPVLTVKSYQREGDYSARITAQSNKDGTLFCSVNGQTESVRCYKDTPVEFRLENKLIPGTQTIQVWATDAAGNVSETKTIIFESYTAPVRATVMAGTSALRNWNSVDGYDYLYLGTNRYGDTAERGAPTKWKVLYADATNTGSRDGLFILADKVPAGYQVEHPVFGAGAGAKVLLTTQQNQLTQQEQDALLATDLPWKKITTEDGLTLTDPVLSGQKLFLLSAGEAANSRYGFVSNDSRGAVINYNNSGLRYSGLCPWALRSTGTGKIQNKSYEVSAIVTENGAVATWDKMTDVLNLAGSNKIANYTFIRPAANLDKSKVLMTSNKDGKSDAVDSALTAPADYEGAEWKLTLIDSGRTGFTANIGGESSVTAAAGDEVAVTYSGALTGGNEYVSTILLDSAGNLLYYGKLANNSADGMVYVTVPEALSVGDYTLKVFSEQISSGWAADYASEPVSIALTVSAEKPAPEAPTAQLGESDVLTSGAAAVEREGDQTMTLSTASVGAAIWYTLTTQVDGGEPYTSEPQQYADGISLTARGSAAAYTVKAWTEQYGKKSDEQTFAVTVRSTAFTLTVIVGDPANPVWTEYSTYQAGETVTAPAPELSGKIFREWSQEDGPALENFESIKNNQTITFAMPGNDVTLTATYVDKISAIEITGIAAPAAGTALDTAASVTLNGVSMTPSVMWTVGSSGTADRTPASGTADYNTVYTANITLTPDAAEYIAFADTLTATVNGNAAAVYRSSGDGSVVIRYTFDATAKAKLTGITAPAGITVPYGTTAAQIVKGLPQKAELATEAGSRYVDITWTEPNIADKTAGQTVDVTGTVEIPTDLDPNEVENTVSAAVTIEAAETLTPPVASLTQGTYTSAQTVQLRAAAGVTIHYQINDGAEQTYTETDTGLGYTQTPAIPLEGNENQSPREITITAYVTQEGKQNSAPVTFTYTIDLPDVYTVNIACEDTGIDLSGYGGSTKWTANYSADYTQGTVTIIAPVEQDEVFSHWENGDGTTVITDENKDSRTLTIDLQKNINLKAVYNPVINKIAAALPVPTAGQTLAATLTSCTATITNTYEITSIMNPVAWTPVTEDGTAAYNTSYTAAISVNQDVLAAVGAKFVFADNVTVTVNGQSATLDRESMTIYYTFPSTSAAKLLSVTPPASPVNLANGIPKEDIKKLALPAKTAIAVEDNSANSAAIDWEDFTYDPASLEEQTFTVNGTVQIPSFVRNPDNVPTTVSVTVKVAAAAQAPKPAAGVASGSYGGTTTVALSTGSSLVEIWYSLNGGAERKYTAPITLEGGAGTAASYTLTARAVPKSGIRMRSSAVATYEYTIAARYPVAVNGTAVAYHYAGETVAVTAPAVAGKQFDSWTNLPADAAVQGEYVTFPMSASAVNLTADYVQAVSTVELTLTAPTGGSGLDNDATVVMKSGGETIYGAASSAGVAWSPSAAAAGYNTEYTAVAELAAPEGYIFTNTTLASVNGANAGVRLIDNRHIQVYQTMTTPRAKLTSIPAASVTGIASHTALADMALPTSIPIVTQDSGVTSAAVIWERTPVEETSYDPAGTDEQTFKLNGTALLPESIDPNGVSLTATLTVTVSAAGKAAAPTASLPSGSTYAEGQSLALSAAAGATIYYTTDGTAPTVDSQRYSGPIDLAQLVERDATYTIKAAAKTETESLSEVVTFKYTIQQKTFIVTVVDENGYPAGTGGGSYHKGDIVTISTPTTGSTRVFRNWTVTAGEATLANANAASTTFTMPEGSVTVQANFKPLVTKVELYCAIPGVGQSLPAKLDGIKLYAGDTEVPFTTTSEVPVTWFPAEGTAGYNKTYTATVKLANNAGQNIVFSSYAQAYLVSGGTSREAALKQNADGSYTVSYTYRTDKAQITAVTNPAGLTGLANGTAMADILSRLPGTVTVQTQAGERTLTVLWDPNPVSGSYDPASTAAQSFTLQGMLDLPDDLANPGNLYPQVSVSVSAAPYIPDPTPTDPTRPCDGGEGCPCGAFTDLDSRAWYHEAVDYVLNNGLMDGVGGGRFAPGGETSRAMVVTILWRLAGSPQAGKDSGFTDVAGGLWYTDAVAWAAEKGIVGGYGSGMFGPADPVTREQLAVMLYRYAKLQGKGFVGSWMFPLDYADADRVSGWAYEAMCWMTMNGVIQGRGGSVLAPQGPATRAEAAAMLMRFSEAMEQ